MGTTALIPLVAMTNSSNEQLSEDDRDTALVEYRALTSFSTDGEESIKGRLEFIEKRFFLACPEIQTKARSISAADA